LLFLSAIGECKCMKLLVQYKPFWEDFYKLLVLWKKFFKKS